MVLVAAVVLVSLTSNSKEGFDDANRHDDAHEDGWMSV